MLFKNLIGSVLSVFFSVVGQEGGWFPVEKAPKVEEVPGEEDRSVWVLFYKDLGVERFSVRFPIDPLYTYTENGDLIVRSELEGEIFELSISRASRGDLAVSDLLYESGGKWIYEHVVTTSKHSYCFQTQTAEPASEKHQQFVSSFSIY